MMLVDEMVNRGDVARQESEHVVTNAMQRVGMALVGLLSNGGTGPSDVEVFTQLTGLYLGLSYHLDRRLAQGVMTSEEDVEHVLKSYGETKPDRRAVDIALKALAVPPTVEGLVYGEMVKRITEKAKREIFHMGFRNNLYDGEERNALCLMARTLYKFVHEARRQITPTGPTEEAEITLCTYTGPKPLYVQYVLSEYFETRNSKKIPKVPKQLVHNDKIVQVANTCFPGLYISCTTSGAQIPEKNHLYQVVGASWVKTNCQYTLRNFEFDEPLAADQYYPGSV